jgi:hypothetical protein
VPRPLPKRALVRWLVHVKTRRRHHQGEPTLGFSFVARVASATAVFGLWVGVRYRCSRHLRPPTPPPPISSFFCLLSPAAAQVAAAVVHCDSRRGPLLVCSHSAEGTIRDADNLLVLSLLTAISGISRLALIISCALHQSRQSGSGAVNSIGCSSCAWAHRRAGHA